MDQPISPAPGETPAAPPTATPAAPAAPPANQPAPAPQPNPTGSEPENNSSGQPPAEPAMVPSDRLREETEKRRQAEERLAELEEAEAQRTAQPSTSSVEEDELDPDVEDLIRKGAKKLGLVSRQELDAEKVNQQVQQDVKTLETQYANSGIPYDHQQVVKYANENNLPIISKAALEAAYRSLNWDKLLEVERQRAIADNHGGGTGGERPGSSGGGTPPSEPEVKGRNPRERGISRIRSARQKLHS